MKKLKEFALIVIVIVAIVLVVTHPANAQDSFDATDCINNSASTGEAIFVEASTITMLLQMLNGNVWMYTNSENTTWTLIDTYTGAVLFELNVVPGEIEVANFAMVQRSDLCALLAFAVNYDPTQTAINDCVFDPVTLSDWEVVVFAPSTCVATYTVNVNGSNVVHFDGGNYTLSSGSDLVGQTEIVGGYPYFVVSTFALEDGDTRQLAALAFGGNLQSGEAWSEYTSVFIVGDVNINTLAADIIITSTEFTIIRIEEPGSGDSTLGPESRRITVTLGDDTQDVCAAGCSFVLHFYDTNYNEEMSGVTLSATFAPGESVNQDLSVTLGDTQPVWVGVEIEGLEYSAIIVVEG